MSSTPGVAHFSSDQRKLLKELELSEVTISELEKIVLPIGDLFQRSTPPVGPVRKCIKRIRDHLLTAQRQLLEENNANQAANLLIVSAACSLGPDMAKATNIPEQLGVMIDACNDALKRLPDQARTRAAHPRPVEEIWRILERTGPRDGNGVLTIRQSTYLEGPFGQIVGICYQAMLREQGDVTQYRERALRAFGKQRQEQLDCEREQREKTKDEFSNGVSVPPKQ